LWNAASSSCNSHECVLGKQMQLIDLNVEGGKLAVSFDKKGGNFKVF
jgi:hypothetical protein